MSADWIREAIRMNPDFIVGQKSLCFCVLLILMISIFTDRRQEKRLRVMLCVALLLFSAIALDVADWMPAEYQEPLPESRIVSRILSKVLTVAAGAAAVLSLSFRQRAEACKIRWPVLFAVLTPIWLAGLYWMMTKDSALMSVAMTLSLLISRFLYQRDMEAAMRKRAEAVENRQAMLFQWQMRPHFIFNSISSIRTLIDADPALAAAGLENLAGYLRKNLDALALETMIPFRRELEHIEQYVALEKMNPANRFEVIYDLQILDFSVPALSVQPLVENAIRHGVRDLGEAGVVFVITERHGEMIRMIVEDNGPGFPKSATPEQKERISHGLESVRRRLESQCGGSLHMHSDGKRTRMVILIPKQGSEEG